MTPSPSDARPWPDFRFARNVVVKAALLFVAVNVLWALFDPLPLLGRVSAYNALLPGRERLPYGEDPGRAYNLSLFQLEAIFASHVLARPKPAGEYRVVLIGDSSVWGLLLRPEDTLAGNLNAAGLTLPDQRTVRVYNLGYPIMSLAKDLLLLKAAMRYQPDMIVWLVTLESFPYDKQLFPPLLQHNPGPVRELISMHRLRLNPNDPGFVEASFWERTLVGRRRALADLLRLQLYGVMWAATGVDQAYPETYAPRQEDFEADVSFHDLQPPHLTEADLAFDILSAGSEVAGETPLLIVNEPIFVSQGKNSHIRYDFFYPRWAYDDYRVLLDEQSQRNHWNYLDLWQGVPSDEFTDSAVHLTPQGSALLAAQVGRAILDLAKMGN
ncbi:MAG: hypothetical protein ACRDH2_06930 [Anaerolineales bacterium]